MITLEEVYIKCSFAEVDLKDKLSKFDDKKSLFFAKKPIFARVNFKDHFWVVKETKSCFEFQYPGLSKILNSYETVCTLIST